jgi:molybdopterin-containing oxidoreductase family membrane subunit
MILNVFFVAMELFTALYSDIPEHVHHFQFLFLGLGGESTLAPWMWLSVVLAVVSLVIMINPSTRRTESTLIIGCVAVFGSLWIDKGLGMVIAGFVPNPLGQVVHYAPTAPELTISLAIYAIGVLIVTALYKIALEVRGQIKVQ